MKTVCIPFKLVSPWNGLSYEDVEICVNEDRTIDYVWIAGQIRTDPHTAELIKMLIGTEARFNLLVERAFSESCLEEDLGAHKKETELRLEKAHGY